MLRFLAVFLVMMGATWAEGNDQSQEYINLDMCHSVDHQFDSITKECIYCAQGLVYNKEKARCEGNLSILGKCFGEDHYHAATQECMYCAKHYIFSEDLRMCVETEDADKK